MSVLQIVAGYSEVIGGYAAIPHHKHSLLQLYVGIRAVNFHRQFFEQRRSFF